MRYYLKYIEKMFTWISYVLATGKQRRMYSYSKMKDRQVTNIKTDAFGTILYYGKTLNGEEPERDYLTWKEFKKHEIDILK